MLGDILFLQVVDNGLDYTGDTAHETGPDWVRNVKRDRSDGNSSCNRAMSNISNHGFLVEKIRHANRE